MVRYKRSLGVVYGQGNDGSGKLRMTTLHGPRNIDFKKHLLEKLSGIRLGVTHCSFIYKLPGFETETPRSPASLSFHITLSVSLSLLAPRESTRTEHTERGSVLTGKGWGRAPRGSVAASGRGQPSEQMECRPADD
jgi:hypothetical protein